MTLGLDLAAVSKSFGSHRVLNQVWLQARGGETIGLVGANGAGKTTMLRIAAGLASPDSGVVRWETSTCGIRYFAGEVTLPPQVRARRWAGFFGVGSTERRRIGALSRGTRQLLGLRVALAKAGPGLLLLDEPWDGLDPAAAQWLTDAVRDWQSAGAAIIISSHRLHDLDDVATRFVLLEKGRCQPVQPQEDESRRVSRIADLVTRASAPTPPRVRAPG